MKILICLVILLPVCWATAVVEPVVVKQAKVNTGVSSQYRAQDSLGNYEFAYDESHAEGGSFRKEAGSAHGPVIGSYGLRDNDGRVRVVNYVADDAGFRAAIATNEPGIVPKAPAAVSITKPGATVVAPVEPVAEVVAPAAAVAAPIVSAPAHAPVVAAPVVAAAPIAHAQQSSVDTYALGINSPLVASLASKIITARPLAYNGAPIASSAYVHRPYAAVAPVAPVAPVASLAPVSPLTQDIIKSYATSIYGPSLLSAPNSIASTLQAAHAPVALAQPTLVKSEYQPPLVSPSVQYLPGQSSEHEPQGYYEPSLAYAHPTSWGYTLGLPSTWGYQMVYRRKK